MRIDLGSCLSFDVVALLHILAVVYERSANGLATTFKLPNDEQARDFLRKNDFPAVASFVTGRPFRFLVDDDDARYFGEVRRRSELTPRRDASSAAIDYLSNRRFFGFRCYGIHSGADRNAVIGSEWVHWRHPLMMRLLESRTRGYPNDFTRVVVQEMLAGLLRDVSGGTVITASQISSEGSQRFLTVGAWQGPAPVTVDLCGRLYRHAVAASASFPDYFHIEDAFEVYDVALEGRKAAHTLHHETTAGTTALELAIKDNAAIVGDAGPFDRGFQALYQSVVSVFDGRLECWAGDVFADLSADARERDPAKYRLTVLPAPGVGLHGSIIAVRIPLGHE